MTMPARGGAERAWVSRANCRVAEPEGYVTGGGDMSSHRQQDGDATESLLGAGLIKIRTQTSMASSTFTEELNAYSEELEGVLEPPLQLAGCVPFGEVLGNCGTAGSTYLDGDCIRSLATESRSSSLRSLLSGTPSAVREVLRSSTTTSRAVATSPAASVAGSLQEPLLAADRAVPGAHEHERERRRNVAVIFLLTLLSMVIQMVFSPIQYLYLERMGWANQHRLRFFTFTKLIQVGIPVVLNPIFGFWQQRRSTKEVYLFMSLACLAGSIAMTFTKNKWVFLVGFIFAQILLPLRIVRSTFLAQTVDQKMRTQVMALNMAFTPIGALIGSLGAQAIGLLGGYSKSYDFGSFDWEFDQFTLNMLVGAVLYLINFLVSIFGMSVIHKSADEEGEGHTTKEVVRVDTQVGGIRYVKTKRWATGVFIYFCICIFSVNFSMGFVQLAFQPVMVDFFHAGPNTMQTFFTIISGLALIPPLLVFILARYGVQDRAIMLSGLLLKVLGVCLFSMPILRGHVTRTQVIIGFILVVKASIFFFTADLSLFSKILGPYATSTMFGVIGAMSAIGPAIATALAGSLISKTFDKWEFTLMGLPAFTALLLIIFPPFFKRLNPDREFVQQVLAGGVLTPAASPFTSPFSA